MSAHLHSVLIVDDDPDDRESIRDAFLENKHHQNYIFVESGSKLLDHLYSIKSKNYPSLILLDLNMPGMDGKQILKEIKSDKTLYQIPVIIMTTSASEVDMRTSYMLGANCFITKPDSYSKLINVTNCIANLWLVYPYIRN